MREPALARTLRFRHGVHPPELKALTAALPIRRMPFPDELVLPLRQHLGKPARLLARVGDAVERGDKLAAADGFVSVPVHASATGVVSEVGLVPHPDGGFEPGLRIAVEPWSAQRPRSRLVPEWEQLSPPQLVAAVQDAGVVGLGGAAFPTHVKLSPPEGKRVRQIVLNGCECEPYLTTDHRTMVEYPERVLTGLRIMMRCLGVERALIGIERNKPDAIEAISAVLPSDLDVRVQPLTVKYPQGAEKMLIKALLGVEVPSGGLPLELGVLVQNVASAATIAEVFETGLPLVERIVTVTGRGVARPANLIVPLGVKLRDVFEACGGLTDDAAEVVLGGPMMGAAVANLDAPVLKGSTGVVVLTEQDCRQREVYACIRCGRCLESCPVFLDPQRLGALAGARRYESMRALHLSDCMLCGCCSYACPSHIPLSQLFRVSRDALRRQEATA
ncbi:MAG: electron transport complex subunit RsxC [Planctomycetota bacterium]|nr:MAG: electron transport complex subunit RsxC [Planctomycetota bacterium]